MLCLLGNIPVITDRLIKRACEKRYYREQDHQRQHKTIKKKAGEDFRKHNVDEIRETIEASKRLIMSEEHTA